MQPNRLSSIDAMRGIAIIGVVAVHAVLVTKDVTPAIASLAAYGSKGVQLFFVLSALTLFTVYGARRYSLADFYIRRFFRVAPMFYVGMLLYLALHGFGIQPFAPDGIGLKQVLLTLTFLHGYDVSSFNAVVPGGWSIACEASFYLIFPILLRWIDTPWRALLALVASFLVAIAWALFVRSSVSDNYSSELVGSFVTFGFPYNLPTFVGGALVYLAFAKTDLAARVGRIPAAVLLAASIAAMLVLALNNMRSPLYAALPITLLVLSVVLLRGAGARPGILSRVGTVSFSIYIVHFVVIDAIRALFEPLLSGNAAFVLVWIATLLVSYLISELTYKYIEIPFISLGKSLGKGSPAAHARQG